MDDKEPEMFRERLHKGYAQSMELAGVVAEEVSRYQKIKIFDTVANGRVMVLDDIVQITTRDESAYAEMLTHLPLLEHGRAERVMIVGGGDLSIADEALKHKSLKEVVLVDIDDRVIELCKLLHRLDARMPELELKHLELPNFCAEGKVTERDLAPEPDAPVKEKKAL